MIEKQDLKEPKTDFGRGLVINLVKFAEHFMNDMAHQIHHVKLYLSKTLKERELMLSENPPSYLNYGRRPIQDIKSFLNIQVKIHGSLEEGLSSLIELWANGATDHLYDIIVPKRWSSTEIAEKVKELQELGLKMGHGFTGEIWKFEDFMKLQTMTREIALIIDRSIGLSRQVDIGNW